MRASVAGPAIGVALEEQAHERRMPLVGQGIDAAEDLVDMRRLPRAGVARSGVVEVRAAPVEWLAVRRDDAAALDAQPSRDRTALAGDVLDDAAACRIEGAVARAPGNDHLTARHGRCAGGRAPTRDERSEHRDRDPGEPSDAHVPLPE